MKKTFYAIAVAALAIIASGCASVETNRTSAPLNIDCPKTFNPTVRVSDRTIEANATVNSLFGIINWGVSNTAVGVDFGTCEGMSGLIPFKGAAEVAREGAVYNACVKNNADFLVAPRYIVNTNDYIIFKTVTCKVIGFPGQVEKVTPVEDIED